MRNTIPVNIDTLVESGVEVRGIPNHIGFLATSDGRIINLRHWHAQNNPAFVAMKLHKDGYYRCRVNKTQGVLVSRLIAMAFHGLPPSPTSVARHLDDNPQNNTPENLAWGTQIDNMEDARRNGTLAVGEMIGSANLTESQVNRIKSRLINGETVKDISKAENVSLEIIRCIRKGKTWKHILSELEQSQLKEITGHRRGANHPATRHTEQEIREMKTRLADGETAQEISRDFKISDIEVYKIARGKVWGHITLDAATQEKLEKTIYLWRYMSGATKANKKIVMEIKQLLKGGAMSQRAIAKNLGVSRNLVSNIARGKSWSEL